MFQVKWKRLALDQLAEIWVGADSDRRKLVTEAVNRFEKDLTSSAQLVGASRSGGRRIHFQPPLAAIFRVDEAGKIVRVLRIWSMRPSS